MKLIVLILVVSMVVSGGFVFAQTPAARDWTWTFTEARDYDGNILGQLTGPTDQPLVFTTTNSNYAVFLYGTLYANQELNSGNIDFVGGGVNYEGLGQGNSGFYQSYSPSIVQPSELNGLLPVAANETGRFWAFTAYNTDFDAVPGEYRVFDEGLNIYDLNEPLGQGGYPNLHSIYSTNDARWTVTPEPISSALFLLGAGALAGARRMRRKV
jgi:hypothetical protein